MLAIERADKYHTTVASTLLPEGQPARKQTFRRLRPLESAVMFNGRFRPTSSHLEYARILVQEETNMSELRIQTKAGSIAMRAIYWLKANKSLSTK